MTNLTEKWTLPEQPVAGTVVIVAGTRYTRSAKQSGTELTLDAWRDEAGTTHTWAELFVLGNGEIKGVPKGEVEAILRRTIVNPDARAAVLKALIDAPTVDTSGETAPAQTFKVGDRITRGMVERKDVTADSIKNVTKMTDRDGDRWERSGDSESWNMNGSLSDNKVTNDLLNSYPTFTVTSIR